MLHICVPIALLEKALTLYESDSYLRRDHDCAHWLDWFCDTFLNDWATHGFACSDELSESDESGDPEEDTNSDPLAGGSGSDSDSGSS